MESKALVKSTNSIVACRFFARTPSRILRIVNICEVVDLFLRKPFWFFQRMLSILGSMWFRSKALYILAAMDVLYLGSSGLIRGHLFYGKGGCIPLSICLSGFDYKLHYSVGVVCRQIVWSSIPLGEFHLALRLFYFRFF